jgi:putative transposase
MIDRSPKLALTKQAALLGISRGSVYYEPASVSDTDLALMRRLDELHLEFPFAGARMLRGLLAAEGSKVGRRHVTTVNGYQDPRIDGGEVVTTMPDRVVIATFS